MKVMIGFDGYGLYSFSPSTKQITISGLRTSLALEQFLLITNVTTNTIIYSFQNSSLGGLVSNNILTLDYDTTLMNSTDSLQIFVDIPDPNADVVHLFQRLTKLLESNATVDSSNRQRVAVETMPTTTVTIATSGGANVTGIGYPATANTVGGNPYTLTASQPMQLIATEIDQRWEIINNARNAYANGIRSKLMFN